jgi:hypothetical protein
MSGPQNGVNVMTGLIRLAAAVALCMLIAAAPARAQSPSPEAMAAAKELIEASRAADQFKTLLPLISQQLKPAIAQGRPEVERDYDQIMPLLTELAQREFAKVAADMAAIYARNFSVEEMRQITAFYRSPVGQAFLDRFPAVAQQSVAVGQKFGEALVKEMQQTLTDELRKRGHKL